MKWLRRTALSLLAIALCAAPAQATAASTKDPAVEPVTHKVGGMTGSELLGEGWVQELSQPVGTFSGGCFPLGRHGKVLASEPDENLEVNCTIKPGTPLFFFFGSECSNVEEDPFFGETEAEQAACAKAFDEEFFVAATITVDDGPAVNVLTPRFELVSPQRSVLLPEDNFLGVDPGPATFVAHGWPAIVRLKPGQHTVIVEVTDVDGFVTTAVATFNVVPGTR
jgi:hypothetical protein